MNRKGSVLLPILIVLFVISLALVAGAFYLYQREHAQNIQLQGQIVELEKTQRLTEGKLEESKKTAAELQLKLQEAKARVSSLTEELSQEKSAHTITTGQLEQNKLDLQKQKSLRQDLEDKLKIAQNDSKKIKEQLKIIQQQKIELEEKIKNAEVGSGSVELGKVVVNSEPVTISQNLTKDKTNLVVQDKVSRITPSANELVMVDQNLIKDKSNSAAQEKTGNKVITPVGKSLEGKVMVVNKEFNFVVINLGVKDNIKVGNEFTVSRDGKSIGDIKIEKVHESMSAAGFPAELRELIRENDKITQKAK
jgi:hypothetical protein